MSAKNSKYMLIQDVCSKLLSLALVQILPKLRKAHHYAINFDLCTDIYYRMSQLKIVV